ncbi:MAG: super-infection exclusion protein B [Shewanella sp.]|uniref:super-infection exclusion protein B n=1 Tax=Shewanella sp. TaxID=50422 RepID=UPI003002F446
MQFNKVLEWLKLSSKQAFILFVISSILLFGQESLHKTLGLFVVKEAAKTWIGIVWLISVATISADIVVPLYAWVSKRIKWKFNLKKCQARLHNLSKDEKYFLAYYLQYDTRTQIAEISNGTVNGLIASKVIFRASSVADFGYDFPFNIHPWAWDYLRKYPGCLN